MWSIRAKWRSGSRDGEGSSQWCSCHTGARTREWRRAGRDATGKVNADKVINRPGAAVLNELPNGPARGLLVREVLAHLFSELKCSRNCQFTQSVADRQQVLLSPAVVQQLPCSRKDLVTQELNA